MIYLFDDIESITDHHLNNAYAYLSKERINRITQYQFSLDKKLSAMAELLLQYTLEREYGILGKLEIMRTSAGKPFLKDEKGLFFNLSHCKEGVACAVSSQPIGVDIQQLVECDHNVLKMVCSDEELKEFEEQHDDLPSKFTRLWTIKEAYIKCIGKGLTENISKYNFAKCCEQQFMKYGLSFKTFTFKNYFLTACGGFHDIKVQKVSLDQFEKKFKQFSKS